MVFFDKGSNIVPSECSENLLVRFLDDGFNSSVDGVVDILELEENLIILDILSGGILHALSESRSGNSYDTSFCQIVLNIWKSYVDIHW